MGLKQTGIVMTLILCCALVLPRTAATTDISQKRLCTGKRNTVMNDGTADPVSLQSDFCMSDDGSITTHYNR